MMPSASDSRARERIFAREGAQGRRPGIAARVRPADGVAMAAVIFCDCVSARDQRRVRVSRLHPGGGGCGDQRGGEDEANESGHGTDHTCNLRCAHRPALPLRSRGTVPAAPGPSVATRPAKSTRPGRTLAPIGRGLRCPQIACLRSIGDSRRNDGRPRGRSQRRSRHRSPRRSCAATGVLLF